MSFKRKLSPLQLTFMAAASASNNVVLTFGNVPT